MCVVDTIGVREARQNLSVYLDRVKAGESLTITEHGRPVAVLGPVTTRAGEEDAYQALIDSGEITPATRKFVARPIPPRRPGELPVDPILEELRAERI